MEKLWGSSTPTPLCVALCLEPGWEARTPHVAAALSKWPGAAGPHPTVQVLALDSNSADGAEAQVPPQRGGCGATMTLGLCPVPARFPAPTVVQDRRGPSARQPQRVPLQET